MSWFKKDKKGDEDMAAKKKTSAVKAEADEASAVEVDEVVALDVSSESVQESDPISSAPPPVAASAAASVHLDGAAIVHELIAEFAAKAEACRQTAMSSTGIAKHVEEVQAAIYNEVVAMMQAKIS